MQTAGSISSIDYTYDKYRNVANIKFRLDTAPDVFFYPSYFPNFKRTQEVLRVGTPVQITHPRDREKDVWSLRVRNEILADFEGVKQSHHSNGNWALICAVGFTAAVAVLEWCTRRRPNPRLKLTRPTRSFWKPQ